MESMRNTPEGNRISLAFEVLGFAAMLITLGAVADNMLFEHIPDSAVPAIVTGGIVATVVAGLGHMISRWEYNRRNA